MHNRIYAIFIPVFLVFSQPDLAATVYNRISSSHSSHHNNHSHGTAEVRKCNPPEENGEVLNGNRSSGIFLPASRRNIQIGKPSNNVYESRISHLSFYPHRISSGTRQLPVMAMLILFPFHAFW